MAGAQSEMSAELQKLSELLADAEKRKSFYLDPDGTMVKQGVDASRIPPALLDTLRGLSHLELGVVARFNTTLRDRLSEDELQQIVQFPV